MIDISKEAKDLADKQSLFGYKHLSLTDKENFILGVIAGHNSKATQAKVLQGQIELIRKIGNKGKEDCYGNLKMELLSINQQLKDLENE
jgi:hypothetical protein